MTLSVDLHDDHLVVSLRGLDALAGLRRSILVPYSGVRDASVQPPEWPGIGAVWGVGTRAPPLVLKGSIGKPLGPWDRFFWQDRKTTRVLKLTLKDHPQYRELHLDVPDAEDLAKRVNAKRK